VSTHHRDDDQVRSENRKEDKRSLELQQERDAAKRRGFSHNPAALMALEGYTYAPSHSPTEGYPQRAAASNLQLISVRTFVGEGDSPEYRTWVPRRLTSSLRLRIDLRDKYHTLRVNSDPDHTYTVTMIVNRPDGGRDDLSGTVSVRRDWEYFYWTCAPAQRHGGDLPPGAYGVEALVQGEAIGRCWFLVVGDAFAGRYPLPDAGDRGTISLSEPVPANLRFSRLAFYDHDGSHPDEKVRHTFGTTFDKSTTCYVGFWFEVENPYIPDTVLATLGRLSPLRYQLTTSIYCPDGSTVWSPTSTVVVPPRERRLTWTHRWGWDQPGRWPTGVYGVEASIGGVSMIRDWFSIRGASSTAGFGPGLSGLLWAVRQATQQPPAGS
jgi:hypothetical protein